MAQRNDTAVSGSGQFQCRPDVNANTTSCSVHSGDDQSVSRRNDTKLTRFGFKAPSATKFSMSDKSAKVLGRNVERQHSVERNSNHPKVDVVDQSILGKGEGTTAELFKTRRPSGNSQLSSGRGIMGRGIFHSDESLARHHVTADVGISSRKQGGISRVASHKQLTSQRSVKRIQPLDSKDTVQHGKNAMDASLNPGDTRCSSKENTNLTDATPATSKPTQVSTVREPLLQNKHAAKIMPGRSVVVPQTNAGLLKSASLLAKQTSEHTRNQRIKMIVNYRSDRSPKALLKTSYCSGDQIGVAGGKTDCAKGKVFNGSGPVDAICSNKNTFDISTHNANAMNGVKSEGEMTMNSAIGTTRTTSVAAAAAAAGTSRAHANHCNGVGPRTESDVLSVTVVSTASTQTSSTSTTSSSEGACGGEIVIMEKMVHRQLLSDLDHYKSLLLQLQRYLTQDVVEDDRHQWNALISLQQENTHLTEQVHTLEKLVTDKNITINSLHQQLSQLTVVYRATDDLHATLLVTDSKQADVLNQGRRPMNSEHSPGDQSSDDCVQSLDSDQQQVQQVQQVQSTKDECLVIIDSDVFCDHSAAKSSRCRVQSDTDCIDSIDSIFDYHCPVDRAVDFDDIRLDGEEECVLSCSDDCSQVVGNSDANNRHHSEDAFTPALNKTFTVNELVGNSVEAVTFELDAGYCELPLSGRAEPSSSSSCEQRESRNQSCNRCSPVLSTGPFDEYKTQTMRPLSRLPGPRMLRNTMIKVNSTTAVNGSCNQTDVNSGGPVVFSQSAR